MRDAGLFEPEVAAEAVRADGGATSINHATDERAEILFEAHAFDNRQPYPTRTVRSLLDGARNDRFVKDLTAAAPTALVAPHVGLVGLDQARQAVRRPRREGGAELVQQGPGRLVASQPRVALEL